MSGLSCQQMESFIDELALDVLPGDLRAVALEHLETCSVCLGRVEELSESADQLLFAYGPVDPPAGFEDRVLDRLAADRGQSGPENRLQDRPQDRPDQPLNQRRNERRNQQHGRRRWRVAAIAAAAAAAVLGVVVGARSVFDQGAATGGHVAAPRGSELRTVALVSSGGRPIGDVSAFSGTPAWFFLRVDHGTESDTYQCVLDVSGGRSIWIGPMVVSQGQGGWGQRVNVDAKDVRAARLVDDSGRTVATATFG